MTTMAKLTDSEVNVSAIRRVDPGVKDLVDSATHVALYAFNAHKSEWDKTNIEGALFIYSRTEDPLYSMFIFNRNSPENLLEPVVKELNLQLNDPFLLYKNKRGLIFGIWFYDASDCCRISDTLQRLVKEQSASKHKKQSDSGLIMNMLSKAQEEYNSHKSPIRSDKPRDLESAPQSVMDFFAKAGVSQCAPENRLPQAPVFGNPTSVIPVLERPAFIVPPTAPVTEVSHPIIQRLMSNPVHSVEHIEKQQRSTTPQTGKEVPGELDSSLLLMRVADSPSHNIIPSQQFFNSNINGESALMPPTMFTSCPPKEAGDNLLNGILAVDPSGPHKHIEPLTKNQIVQAVSHLLKHDPDFVNKLHEAYLNSFKDVVST